MTEIMHFTARDAKDATEFGYVFPRDQDTSAMATQIAYRIPLRPLRSLRFNHHSPTCNRVPRMREARNANRKSTIPTAR